MSDDKSDKDKLEKGKLQAGATMQIDLDQVQLVDLEASRPVLPASGPASRKTPPPLPPGMTPGEASGAPPAETAPSPGSPGSSVAPAPAPPARVALHVGIIVLVVGVAAAAGLIVARAVRGGTATTAPSAAEPSATHTAPVDSVLTIPPIEVR